MKIASVRTVFRVDKDKNNSKVPLLGKCWTSVLRFEVKCCVTPKSIIGCDINMIHVH